ncbi:MAG: hypothetical protein GEU28_14170 [Dehalococcoidia bacterium]|nr:hypothetical protein [Dehalococcoidia bacterium]
MGHDDRVVRETVPFHRWLDEHRLSRRAAIRGTAGAGAALAAAFGARPIQAAVRAAQGASASPETLIVAWDQVPDNLDPQTARGNRNWWVLAEIYDTLTYLPEGSLDPAPQLAESWEVSPDGLNYTFKLRQGVKFTTGAELTAEAVKFSINRLHEIQLGPLYMTAAYDRSEVIDPTTVAFTLKYPYPAWPVILSNPAVLGVIDPAFVEANGGSTPEERNDFISTNTAGTGAFMLQEWQQGQRIVLARNPDYWKGWDGPHVEEVILETVPEESTRLLRLERGDVDIATVTANTLPQLEQRIESQNLPIVIQKERDGQPLLSLSTMWLNLNNRLLPTSDINVRKALIHTFNHDLWIETVLKGYGLRMEGMIPRGVLGHVDDYPSYPYDLAKAKEFLDQASPEAKAELEKGLLFRYASGYVIYKEGALLWQQDLDQIGIKLDLEEIDQATLSSLQTSAPGVPIVEARWFPDYPDPDNFINAARTDYWPPEGYGAAFAGDEQTDELVASGRAEQDPEERAAIYRELELYFHEQASILMLAEISGVINPWNARAAWVQGFEHNPMIHPLYYPVYKEEPA